MSLTPEQRDYAALRLMEIQEQVSRLAWQWRMTTYKHQCEDGSCGMPIDPTDQAVDFAERLKAVFEDHEDGFGDLCEALTAAVIQIASIPAQPPEHLWVATNDDGALCSCGWDFDSHDKEKSKEAWLEHSGGGLKTEDWQLKWLEASSGQEL